MPDPTPVFDAWNPGLNSAIPSELFSLVTLYNAENSGTRYQEAKESASFCGLKPQDMVAFKVSRLAMHEVLIRVTADLHVTDGPNYEELGISLRSMVDRILTDYVYPELQALEQEYLKVQSEIKETLSARLEADLFSFKPVVTPKEKRSLMDRIFGKRAEVSTEEELPELRALSKWDDAISKTDDALDLACLQNLHAIVGGIIGQRGRLIADKDIIVRLASIRVCNTYGSDRIGELINPLIRAAVKAEGYRFLPFQVEPFIMNVKGASAAGKSTLRPLQRKLAARLGVQWEDFALVSPDYWRKYMLDYDSLGADFKYAAMLTGQELEIIDEKLDKYIEAKATRQEIPHLLIDRFRFDSFDSSHTDQPSERLLSRFGHTVFLFFVITPSTETIERAWLRGKQTGRYKAVDDLLYHNIEAYTGMPQLFLNWVNKKNQKIHFEFLDNDVPFGQTPKTVAYGWNEEINILDLECMRRLTSYTRINVDAKRPEDVYLDVPSAEDDIIGKSIGKIACVNFFDPVSLGLCARIRNGECLFENADFLTRNNIEAADCSPPDGSEKNVNDGDYQKQMRLKFDREKTFTIGQWGSFENGV